MADRDTIRKELKTITEDLRIKREMLAHMTHGRVALDLKRMKVDRELLNREAEVILAVCNAVNQDGKPLYGNETIRKAEVTARLAADTSATKGVSTSDRFRRRISKMKMEEALIEALIANHETMERIYLLELESAI